jgi:hypothetical protein
MKKFKRSNRTVPKSALRQYRATQIKTGRALTVEQKGVLEERRATIRSAGAVHPHSLKVREPEKVPKPFGIFVNRGCLEIKKSWQSLNAKQGLETWHARILVSSPRRQLKLWFYAREFYFTEETPRGAPDCKKSIIYRSLQRAMHVFETDKIFWKETVPNDGSHL